MKLNTILSIAFIALVCSVANAQTVVSQPATTLILVRHAEKKIEPENKDPELSPAGELRAQEIVRMFSDAGINAIYASEYKRTQNTVKPLADKLGLTVGRVEAKKTADLVKQIRSTNAGQVVFIAGHNNTVPEIIAAFGGPEMPIIPESDFDNLYILTVYPSGPPHLLKLKYGSPVKVAGQTMMAKP